MADIKEMDLSMTLEEAPQDEVSEDELDEARRQELEEYERANADHAYAIETVTATTTPVLEGYAITDYVGIVSRDIVVPYELVKVPYKTFFKIDAISRAKEKAISALKESALEAGADAVVGVSLELTPIKKIGIMVTASGTAVKVEKNS